MMGPWVLCLLLAAGEPAPDFHDPTPPALRELLAAQPALLPHHQGYLKELARLPDLAESESAWWQASSRPALRGLAAQFEELVGGDAQREARFDAYFDKLLDSPDLRDAVENLLRTELEQTREQPALARAVQFLRAHPDLAMRFLENPNQVRPLPEPLEGAYDDFVDRPEWRAALQGALGKVLERPAAHLAVLPWWEQLETLASPLEGGEATFTTALYDQPQALWLWHLRNINLARDREARPWIRYWNRLIHRDPALAQAYGPFITNLLRDPESLRQHLADLQTRQARDAEPWPPQVKPPLLPPLDMARSVSEMQGTIARPDVDIPERPSRPRMEAPTPPTPPAFPQFPTAGEPRSRAKERRPTFPEFPDMRRPAEQRRTESKPE